VSPRDATMAGMVLEIADFAVLPGKEDEFVAAVREGLAYVTATPGCQPPRVEHFDDVPSR
jgi:hypothetical protein